MDILYILIELGAMFGGIRITNLGPTVRITKDHELAKRLDYLEITTNQ